MKTQGQFLKLFYENYRRNRKSLSLRAFSKYLDLDPSRLNDFVSDKHLLSLKAANKIAERLKLDAETKSLFLGTIKGQIDRKKRPAPPITLSAKDFKKISDWHYFAILALADSLDFDSNPRTIANRLNISREATLEGLAQLTKLGLLELRNNKYFLTNSSVTTENDIPSADLRKSHKQSLKRVLKEIDSTDPTDRTLQSTTFAGDPKKIKLAKNLISKMMDKVVAILESGKRTEIYELNLQLFPIVGKPSPKKNPTANP